MNDDVHDENTVLPLLSMAVDEPEVTEPAAPEPALAQFQCAECHRIFGSAPALRMHKIRKHSPRGDWDTRKNFQGNLQTRNQRLEKRRQYQLKLRNRYLSEGRNSRGEQMPPGWKPRGKNKRSYPTLAEKKTREDYRAKQREYQRNHYAKVRAARLKATAAITEPTTGTIPDITGEAARAIMVAASVIRAVTTGMRISK